MAIITISRGSYTKGKEIAEKVADRLSYRCISRDVLLETSEHFNIPEIRLARALHDAPSVLERFTHGRQTYMAFIERTFLESVMEDNVVYHGLAGHFFLRGLSHALKVRIIADLDLRVSEEMEREGISRSEAQALLKKDDYERRRWSLALYGIDTRDPILYDLTINICNLTVDCAVEMISHAAQGPCFKTTEASQKTMEALVLAAKVRSVLVSKWPNAHISSRDGDAYIDIEAPLIHEVPLSEEITAVVKTIPEVRDVKVNVRPTAISSS
jgi:cytidylate kinase